jgi:hypothetical protein
MMTLEHKIGSLVFSWGTEMKISFLAIIIMLAICPSICAADETISGQYCYTYGDNESLKEAKELTHTLAIRNAIESYRAFMISSSNVKDFTLTNDIIQIISSGYMKDIRTIESKVEGRTVCEKIQATVKPQAIEDVVRRSVQKRQDLVEQKGIDNNRTIKLLSVKGEFVEFSGIKSQRATVTYQALVDISNYKGKLNSICIDIFDENENPLDGQCNSIKDKIKYQFGSTSFHLGKPNEKRSYRVWLPQN